MVIINDNWKHYLLITNKLRTFVFTSRKFKLNWYDFDLDNSQYLWPWYYIRLDKKKPPYWIEYWIGLINRVDTVVCLQISQQWFDIDFYICYSSSKITIIITAILFSLSPCCKSKRTHTSSHITNSWCVIAHPCLIPHPYCMDGCTDTEGQTDGRAGGGYRIISTKHDNQIRF